MKKGDIIRTRSGRFGTIVRSSYAYRFMDGEDWAMVHAGMGHLAGVYGTAVDVLFTNTGRTQRLKISDVKLIDSDDA